jgi:hypothetical protein
MSTTNEGGFEGPLPSSIKPDGFPCHRRGGCDREALCERAGECFGIDRRPENGLSDDDDDEIVEIECMGGAGPLAAHASNRNRFDEIAEIVRTLSYAEMIRFAGGLWRLRGRGEVSRDTLPKILYAWATAMESGSLGAVHTEPVLPAGEFDGGAKKFQPIDTAPKDEPILAFMLGRWRIARWKPDQPRKKPMPFWSADDLRVTVSRAHQPIWWAELPPSPPEIEE